MSDGRRAETAESGYAEAQPNCGEVFLAELLGIWYIKATAQHRIFPRKKEESG